MSIESFSFLPAVGYLEAAELEALATAELTSALFLTALLEALEMALATALELAFTVSWVTQWRCAPAPTAVSTLNSAVRPSAMLA